MVQTKHALDVLADYAVKEIVPAMSDQVKRFGSLMTIGAMKVNPMPLLNKHASFLITTGIISEDLSLVDKKTLEAAFDFAFMQMPKVTIIGLDFTKRDAENLLERMVDDDE